VKRKPLDRLEKPTAEETLLSGSVTIDRYRGLEAREDQEGIADLFEGAFQSAP
jgi:hypothetical protein